VRRGRWWRCGAERGAPPAADADQTAGGLHQGELRATGPAAATPPCGEGGGGPFCVLDYGAGVEAAGAIAPRALPNTTRGLVAVPGGRSVRLPGADGRSGPPANAVKRSEPSSGHALAGRTEAVSTVLVQDWNRCLDRAARWTTRCRLCGTLLSVATGATLARGRPAFSNGRARLIRNLGKVTETPDVDW